MSGGISMSLNDEINKASKDVKTHSYSMSIGEIVSIYKEEDLNVHPEYQRMFRWDINQKSKLIESILIGIPIPPIYVFQKKDGVWDLIDGQQRLSTIFQFMNILKDEENIIVTPERLVKTKFLPSLEGKQWDSDNVEESLDDAQRRFIKRAKLDVIIIDETADKQSQYEMFQRLNTGGTHLSSQEIRNCILIMQNKEKFKILERMSSNATFKNILPLPDSSIDEQGYMEFIVRYLILRYANIENADEKININDFYTDEIINIIENPAIDLTKEEEIFNKAFNLLYEINDDQTFKKYNVEKNRFEGAVVVSAFESIIPGITRNINKYEKSSGQILEKIKSIYSNATFYEAIRRGIRPITRLKKLNSLSLELFS